MKGVYVRRRKQYRCVVGCKRKYNDKFYYTRQGYFCKNHYYPLPINHPVMMRRQELMNQHMGWLVTYFYARPLLYSSEV